MPARKKNFKHASGFTLLEAMFALGISAIFLTNVISVWYFSSVSYKEEISRNEMRYGVDKTMEKIKADVRLTDGNKILFYPAGVGENYTAISMPRASPDTNGFYALSPSITWNETIVYHVFDNAGKKELRRTVFPSFVASTSARQTLLNTVAADGSATGAVTTTLFDADTLELEIIPTSPVFDGYGAEPSLSTSTSFGSLQLAPGAHNIRFIAAGKNAGSSGYRIGFDQLTLSPSGGGREAEALVISASNGKGSLIQDMSGLSAFGMWNGNHQIEYLSSAINDYIEFQLDYDQWRESNFSNMTHSNTEVIGTDPGVRVATRENQSLAPVWKADSQTGADPADATVQLDTQTVRNIISAASMTKSGDMVRFKFMSSSTGSLDILSAYFGPRDSGTANFSDTPVQLHFENGAVSEDDMDGTGAIGSGGATGISIAANSHAWTNWIPYPITNPATSDYLVSFSVPSPSGPADGLATQWDFGTGLHSYVENGDTAALVWQETDLGYATGTAIHALAEMSAWTADGTVTSQIYDTKMTSPVFNSLLWTTSGAGNYSFKVRASDDAEMNGATTWSEVPACVSSPCAPSVSNQRYVQWQATLSTPAPYIDYPGIDNVILSWPGQTAIVDFSGYYTKKSDYGMFSVEVDGLALVNALQVNMTASRTYKEKNHAVSLSVEVKARNTGK